MVNRGTFGTGREGDPVLAPQAEPLLIQIPPQTIQDGDNTKEAKQYKKTSALCRLLIWKVPQEAVEKQSQTLRWFNQEALRDHTQGCDLNRLDGLFPTRAHSPSHRGSNIHNIINIHRINGLLLQLLLRPTYEGNVR